MSHFSPKPDQQTSSETALLTALNNLSTTPANQAVAKTGVASFANVDVSGISNITGFIAAGANVTITGSGTLVSPYTISSVASGGTWGSITGTLSSQTDLQNALDALVPYTGATGDVDLGANGITVTFLNGDEANIYNGGNIAFYDGAPGNNVGSISQSGGLTIIANNADINTSISIIAGSAVSGANPGGNVQITGGVGGETGNGGSFTFISGAGGSTRGGGGDIDITSGSAANSGGGGSITITAGDGAYIGEVTNIFNFSSGGINYSANDVVTIVGGNNDATITIDTVNGGGTVLTFHLTTYGTGYVNATNVATTYGGAGTGFLVDTSVTNGDGGDLYIIGGVAGDASFANGEVYITTGQQSDYLDIVQGSISLNSVDRIQFTHTSGNGYYFYSGTGAIQGIFDFSSLTTSNKTFIFPDASGTLYVTGGTDVSLADGGTGASLSDPGANTLLGWDDTDNAVAFLTIGSGLTYTHSSHTLSASGGASGSFVWQMTGSLASHDNYYTYYAGSNANAAGTDATISNLDYNRIYMPRAGTIQKLNVYLKTNTRQNSTTFAIALNGTEQTLAVAFAGSATGLQTDNAHPVTVAAGDYIQLVDKNTAGTGALQYVQASVEYA